MYLLGNNGGEVKETSDVREITSTSDNGTSGIVASKVIIHINKY